MSVTFTGQLHRRLSGLSGPVRGAPAVRSGRRVRQEVRDGMAVVAFSAAASSAVALVIAVLTRVAG